MGLYNAILVGAAVGLFIGGVAACDDFDGSKKQDANNAERLRRAWEGPCTDTATLLATTSGSPSSETCTNKRHRMRVQLSSGPSKEEYGALIFCECERDAGALAPADAGAK